MAKVSSHQEALNIAKELHEELGRVQDDIKEQGLWAIDSKDLDIGE